MPTAGLNENDRLDSSIWKITTVAVFGSFLSQLDATVVNVSLSSLAVELHSSLTVKCRSAVVRSAVFVPNWDHKFG